MPPCQPTCIHLHGPPDCNVDKPCVQGCACDAGFVLRRSVCVPIERCGCVDHNGDIHNFDDEWYTAHCSQKCECDEDDGIGKIDCDDEDECDGDDVCLQNAEGQYNCFPTDFSECTIKGDPEYRTFDDWTHRFRGQHSYVLAMTTSQSRTGPGFYIEGINVRSGDHSEEDDDDDDHHDSRRESDDDSDEDDSRENNSRYRLRELKIRVYNHTVEFKRNRRLVVDGRVSHPPVSPSGGLTIRRRSSHLYLKTDFGLSVEFDGHSRADITLPHIYRRKVGGLCGNFDGRKRNDMMKPDGRQARTVQEFGQSWRVILFLSKLVPGLNRPKHNHDYPFPETSSRLHISH
ncbi:Zonadhesin [Merluccius polli]|uniref:Zonadhesin n=1 Tax=Merluccius polli TaxID=89951 RepID=A0AA47NST3_MERPO|nr:Zonadhesin [Merluccius polli]